MSRRADRRRDGLAGRTAYISGAASGIGRALAVRFSGQGSPVAIVDQDADGLQETAELLAGPALVRTLDVRDRQATMAIAAEVAEWAPAALGMVFNNAGVTTLQGVADGAVEDDEWVTEVNFGGVVNGTRAFLPILLRQSSGVILNTSSVFGLVGIPFQSAYCASKFAVRGFTESLRHELRDTGVDAVTIHPGGIKTNVVRNARYHAHPLRADLTHDEMAQEFEAMAFTTPEKAARIIHDGMLAGKTRILVGPDAYVFDALARAMPNRYFDVLSALENLNPRRRRPGAAALQPPEGR
jgi:NAD(P)-dependent dehydrogenase (short-subunit alcohol dehydrogenase family)